MWTTLIDLPNVVMKWGGGFMGSVSRGVGSLSLSLSIYIHIYGGDPPLSHLFIEEITSLATCHVNNVAVECKQVIPYAFSAPPIILELFRLFLM